MALCFMITKSKRKHNNTIIQLNPTQRCYQNIYQIYTRWHTFRHSFRFCDTDRPYLLPLRQEGHTFDIVFFLSFSCTLTKLAAISLFPLANSKYLHWFPRCRVASSKLLPSFFFLKNQKFSPSLSLRHRGPRFTVPFRGKVGRSRSAEGVPRGPFRGSLVLVYGRSNETQTRVAAAIIIIGLIMHEFFQLLELNVAATGRRSFSDDEVRARTTRNATEFVRESLATFRFDVQRCVALRWYVPICALVTLLRELWVIQVE